MANTAQEIVNEKGWDSLESEIELRFGGQIFATKAFNNEHGDGELLRAGIMERRESLLVGTPMESMRRGRLEIVADMLEVMAAPGGGAQTMILSACNLSNPQLKPMLKYGIDAGFWILQQNTDFRRTNAKQVYIITQKGRRFLAFVRAAQQMMALVTNTGT